MLIGYHAVYDPDYKDAIQWAAGHGFDYVQFDLNVPRFFLDDVSRSRLAEIHTFATDHGVGLSFHAPGDDISLFTDYPHVREGIVRQMETILERANVLGARHLTVHPGSPPGFRKAGEEDDSFRREYHDHYATVFADNLRRLGKSAGDVMICVENYGWVAAAFEAIQPLLGAATGVWLCWDIAKSASQPGAEEFYRRNTVFIREVHVHDMTGQGRQHEVVGDGILPFQRYADILSMAHVATTIEVRPREAAWESRRRLLQRLTNPAPSERL